MENLDFAVRELLRYDSLAEYVEPHAENFFQNLKWHAIEDLDKHKVNALNRHNNSYALQSKVIFIYRNVIEYIEAVYNQHYKVFMEELRVILDDAVDIDDGEEDRIHEMRIMNHANDFMRSFNQEVHKRAHAAFEHL